MTEERLAEIIINYLHDLHWDVYQEVALKQFDGRADIVAVQNNRVWVIETKMTMCLTVIAQAMNWQRMAHWVSVAVPLQRKEKDMHYGQKICRKFGIGVLRASEGNVSEKVEPVLFRKAEANRFLEGLCEEHKTFAKAGNAGGYFFSPYQKTCRDIVKIVTEHPGIMLKELIDSVDHHYASDSSAKSSISHWVHAGKIKGITLKREGKFLRFYPDDQIQSIQRAV